MVEPRQPKLGIVVGEKGCGKSTLTFRQLLQVLAGNLDSGTPRRRVLIVDFNNEYEEFKCIDKIYRVRAIDPKHIPLFSENRHIEMRRIVPFTEKGRMSIPEMQETLYNALNEFANGVMLIEDLNKFISHTFSLDVIGKIVTSRHANLEIIVQVQSKNRINNVLFENFNWIRLHTDSYPAIKMADRIPTFYIYLQIAEAIIAKKVSAGDKHYAILFHKDGHIIEGDFTEDEAHEAILTVISRNKNAILRPLTDQMDTKGKKIYTPEKAIQKLINDFMTNNIRMLSSSAKPQP